MQVIIIEGKGTISVTEPGRDLGTYYENAEITIFGTTVHFQAYGKFKTAELNNCLIGWEATPSVRESAG